MAGLRNFLQQAGSRNPWIDRPLRLLMVAALVIALGVAGSGFAEYRVLNAVAALPRGESAAALPLDCPPTTTKARGRPEGVSPVDTRTPPAPLMLRGFRCTIPFSPD